MQYLYFPYKELKKFIIKLLDKHKFLTIPHYFHSQPIGNDIKNVVIFWEWEKKKCVKKLKNVKNSCLAMHHIFGLAHKHFSKHTSAITL